MDPRTGPALAIFAHPDDAEICAGATLAKWARAGRDVHLLILTNGDRGSQDAGLSREEIARTRLAESEEGAAVMGLASVRVLSIHDGELENTATVREAVTRRIREVRAETVLSCDPTAVFFENLYYNHADHRNAGWTALDSVFPGSGNPHFFPEHIGEGLEVRGVTDVWLGWTNDANHTEDVSGLLRTKVDALAGHPSQLAEGIRFFEDWFTEEMTEAGLAIDAEHGERFRVLDLS